MTRSVEELELTGKRVFVRLDLDVPAEGASQVQDDTLIRAALPTLKLALERGARVIVGAHLGTPEAASERESLEPAAARLAELLDQEVKLADDCVGDGVRKLVLDMRNGELVVLENLCFHPGEDANDPELARQLAGLCEVYVNEAFGSCHRAQASLAAMVPLVNGPRVAGLRLREELDRLDRLRKDPARPFVVALGDGEPGQRLRDVESLLPRVQALLLGGSLGLTFLRAQGRPVGNLAVDEAHVEAARFALEAAPKHGCSLVLPVDHVCEGGEVVDQVPEGHAAVDTGPKTRTEYRLQILRARTALWCGAMGVREGNRDMARALAEVKGQSVAGGGEGAAALRQLGLAAKVGHVSTGDTACLAFVTGRELPGLKALE